MTQLLTARPWRSVFLAWLALALAAAASYRQVAALFFVNEDFTWLWCSRVEHAMDWLWVLARDSMGGNYSWRPLVQLSFAAQQWIWGWNPTPIHLWALGWHLLAAAVLIWALAARTGVLAAWLGALVFAVHPLQVESLAWASALGGPLSTALLCLAVLGAVVGSWSPFRVAPLFFLALAAQENALAGLLLVPLGMWLVGKQPAVRLANMVVALSVAAVLFLLWRWLASPAGVAPPGSFLERGSPASLATSSLLMLNRFTLGVAAVAGSDSSFLGGLLCLLWVALAAQRWRQGDGLALWGFLWFALSLLPYTTLLFGLAPRYYHLPLAGLGTSVASLAAVLEAAGQSRRWLARLLIVLAGVGWFAGWQRPIREEIRVWQTRGEKTQALLADVRRLVPEVPPRARFAFYGLRDLRLKEGVFVFGLEDALRLLYRDGSVEVVFRPFGMVEPDESRLVYWQGRLWRLGEQPS